MAPIPTTEKVLKDVRDLVDRTENRMKGLQRQVTECTKEDGESAKPDSHRRSNLNLSFPPHFSFKPHAFYENLNISSNMGIESPIDRTAMATNLEALEEGIEGQLVKDADACAREEQLQAMCSGLLEQIEKEEFRAAPLSRESAYNVGKTLQLDLGKFTWLSEVGGIFDDGNPVKRPWVGPVWFDWAQKQLPPTAKLDARSVLEEVEKKLHFEVTAIFATVRNELRS